MWLVYQFAIAAALVAAGPFLLARRGSHYLASVRRRLGRYESTPRPSPIWLHAVSVGEVSVAATLARRLPDGAPLLVTTVTPSGNERARQSLGARAAVEYLPFELGFAVGRFFERFRPAALILAEGDYWPLVLRRARRDGVPIAVVNGRVSDGSFRRMRRLKRWLGPLFAPVDVFAVQTAADRDRLLALGVAAERVHVTGNLKFETADSPPQAELAERVGRLAGGRPLLVAGSTMRGEEELVLDAFARLGGGRRALLVLAPRHPERWGEVRQLVTERGLEHAVRSEPAAEDRAPEVLLLDTLGELAGLYRLADAAFIGGTLVPTGGHNPLEAARFGVPVAVGPSMENFRAIAEAFDEADAWGRVTNAAGLAALWRTWLDEPRAARVVGAAGAALVEANRGALDRTLEALRPLLARVLDAGDRQP